jgi:CheY-like chemotaxis protein
MSTKYKYILIDDSMLDLFINEKMLNVHELAESVVKFSDPRQALEFISAQAGQSSVQFVILLDLQMPVMNGFQFVDGFRQVDASLQAKFRIIMLSSTIDSQDIQRAKADPQIVEIMTKPLNPERLQSILATLSW